MAVLDHSTEVIQAGISQHLRALNELAWGFSPNIHVILELQECFILFSFFCECYSGKCTVGCRYQILTLAHGVHCPSVVLKDLPHLFGCIQAKTSLKQIHNTSMFVFFNSAFRCALCHFFNLLLFSVALSLDPLPLVWWASGLLLQRWWTWRATTIPLHPLTSRCWAAPCAPTTTSWKAWRSSRTSPSPSTATPWAPWTSTTTSPPAMALKVPLH